MGNRSKSISIRGDLASLLLRDPASLLQAQDVELGRGGREVGGRWPHTPGGSPLLCKCLLSPTTNPWRLTANEWVAKRISHLGKKQLSLPVTEDTVIFVCVMGKSRSTSVLQENRAGWTRGLWAVAGAKHAGFTLHTSLCEHKRLCKQEGDARVASFLADLRSHGQPMHLVKLWKE